MKSLPKIKSAAFRVGGKIHTGPTHGHIYADIGDAIEGAEEGFVTDAGEFLTRSQALTLARASNQVPSNKPTIRSTDLDSGDVIGTKGYRKFSEDKNKKKIVLSTKDITIRNPHVAPMIARGTRVFKDKREKSESKYSHKYKQGRGQHEDSIDSLIADRLNKMLPLDEAYHAFLIAPESRDALLKKHPPQYSEVIAHHVTHSFGVAKGSQPPQHPKNIEVIGHVDDGKGVQAAVVKVDGSEYRPDGKRYHVTISIDRSKGRKPAHSNDVIDNIGYKSTRPYSLSAQSKLMESKPSTNANKKIKTKRPGVSGSTKELATATVADMVARDYVSPEEDKLAAQRDNLEKKSIAYGY